MTLHHRWIEIKKLVDEGNIPLMKELAMLDLATPEGRKNALKHSEYFEETDQDGSRPVPLSIIRALAEVFASTGERRGVLIARPVLRNPGDLPMRYGLHLSLFELDDLPRVSPSRETADLRQGDLVQREGSEMVVFQVDDPSGRIHLIPRRLVDPTC